MAFTYSLSSEVAEVLARSRVRLLVSDTNEDAYAFEDDELDYFLTLEGSDVRLAAATAFETWARDRAKLAKRKKVGDTETEQQTIADLLAAAKRLRDGALTGGLQTATIADSADGERLSEFYPGWRDNDLLVVE